MEVGVPNSNSNFKMTREISSLNLEVKELPNKEVRLTENVAQLIGFLPVQV